MSSTHLGPGYGCGKAVDSKPANGKSRLALAKSSVEVKIKNSQYLLIVMIMY